MEAITETEVARALSKLKNDKAAGTDHIQPELLKQSYQPDEAVWQSKEVSTEWKNDMIVPLPKKGDLSDCNNWRGITLLSVLGSVLVYTAQLLGRIRKAVDTSRTISFQAR